MEIRPAITLVIEWATSLLLSLISDILLGVSSLLLGSGLSSSGISLGLELLLSDLLLLHLVDGLDEDGLVLVLVTLGGEVEVVVDVLVDLLGLSVLPQESSEHSLASHPEDLLGHTGISGTLSLTVAGVSALPLGLVDSVDSGSRVHVDLSLHDDAVLEELSDVLPCRALAVFNLIKHLIFIILKPKAPITHPGARQPRTLKREGRLSTYRRVTYWSWQGQPR